MTAPAPPVADAGYRRLKARVVAHSGHHYYENKDAQLWERLARRMDALGLADPASYLARLDDAAAGPPEWRALESELTIKETFFFRFAEQFAALRATILPGLIAARRETRRLRLWSAGCSTGAEPYSLAVVVSDLLGPEIERWHVSILGTDIDEAALAAARTARFGDWALRATTSAERRRLFEAESAGSPRVRLRAPWRHMVRFERLNILDLLGGAAPLPLADCDLILCRNLLIYFRADIATRLVTALGARLRPDGWLLLGHAEAGLAADSGLVPDGEGWAVGYRHPASTPPPAAAKAPSAPSPRAPRRPRAATTDRREAPIAVDRVEQARALLAAGDTAAARALLAEVRGVRPADALPLYLAGLAATAAGDAAAAERAWRGALYLDGGFAMAHYLLGRQLLAAGRADEGRRALGNALGALAGQPGEAAVPEGDGATAAELRGAIGRLLAEARAVG